MQYGLYQAQQTFFYSWFILAFGLIPFPGGKLVLWVLFFNLLANMVIRFSYGPRHLGIVTLHMGLLIMMVGAFFTHRYGEESFLSLMEGEGSNLSSSYHHWEISAWRDQGALRDVVAVDADHLHAGHAIDLREEFGLELRVDQYAANADAFAARDPGVETGILNATGIIRIEPKRTSYEPAENVPGGLFTVTDASGRQRRLLLFGMDERPTQIVNADGEPIFLTLRRQRHPLPVMVRLVRFEKAFHPNSQIPRSFASYIEVDVHGVIRDVVVEMNQPFRFQGYTFYQASYADLESGAQVSTFAVAKNYARLLPYIGTAVTFIGLAMHFLIELYRRRWGGATT